MRTITKTWVMPEAWEVIEPANELEKKAASEYCKSAGYADVTEYPLGFLFLADQKDQLNTPYVPYVRVKISKSPNLAVYAHVWCIQKRWHRFKNTIRQIEQESKKQKRACVV
ncbi:hypothetical protein [Leptospira santarosai]|uniref:hypothetical protein n=1 Tax=Leptospira santarosai TaxID=28183 RepID=UPI000774E071|nr:hypothetical protein [Leptospira santarosai]